MPQDLPVGREVMRVSATDIDDGNNSVVRYNLSSKRPDDAAYFRIDHESGVIYLNQVIDVSNMRDKRRKEMCLRKTLLFYVYFLLETIIELPQYSLANSIM